MPRIPRDFAPLTLQLQATGMATARELATQLAVSQPTISRLLSELAPRIETIGQGRSTRYALRRDVRQYGNQWPIYRVTPEGKPHPWGTLRALHGPAFRFIPQGAAPGWMGRDYSDGIFSGLPFFLQDIRPQGYLGRAIARRLGNLLRAPLDPLQWQDDDVLSYFLAEGEDLPGDIIVGDDALVRADRLFEETGRNAVAPKDRGAIYPQQVEAILRGEVVGSSAGGEQPKFLTAVRLDANVLRPAIVKFSPGDQSAGARRWSDLLATEHIALEVLRTKGIDTARTEIIDAGGRRFLEIERFDRTEVQGRRGVITLGTLEDAFLDRTSSNWAEASLMLLEAGLVDEGAARTLRLAWCFGGLIANTDMHRANASFWFSDAKPFQITPIYDMLPMMYRPNAQGEVVPQVFQPGPPRSIVADVWSLAASAALDFWQKVSIDEQITAEFRSVAAVNRDAVARLVERYG